MARCRGGMVSFKHKGKTHFVPQGTDIEDYKASLEKANYPYTPETGEKIVMLYVAGHSLTEISKTLKIPYHTIHYWKNRRADFRKDLEAARQGRAFYYEDKALETAEATKGQSSEEVAAARLKVDTYKWAAGVNNPETFGTKTKILGDPNQPLQIIVNTGIIREEDQPIEVPSEVVEQVTE